MFRPRSHCFLLSALLLGACSEAPVGSKRRPFTMYFVPSVDAQQLTGSGEKMIAFMSKYISQKLYGKDEGFYMKSAVPASYIAVVEAFGTGRADFAAFNTFSYVLAKDIKKYPIEAVFTVERGGERIYKGAIIAHKNSGIKELKDLSGKKFAYTDPASTSGYLLPAQLFERQGIKLGHTVFGQKHDSVVTMVYQRQVDAGAVYYGKPQKRMVDGKEIDVIVDARARVKTQFPDVEDKVKIVGFTEEIPNEPWVIRSNLFKDAQENEKVKAAVVEAMAAFAKSPEGQKELVQNYTISGLLRSDDTAYEGIRKIVADAKLDLQQLSNKK